MERQIAARKLRWSRGERSSRVLALALFVLAQQTSAVEVVVESHHYEYDELGRLIREFGNSGQSVNYSYDNNDGIKTISDALGNTTTLTYDGLGRVSSSKDARNGTTTYTYDKGDQVTSVTDARAGVTTYSVDGFGQIWSQVSPDTGAMIFSYDAYGRRTAMDWPTGHITSYGHDALGRVTSVSAASSVQSFTYDSCTNGKGLLCGFTDPSGSTSYAYAPQGSMVSQVSVMPAGGSASLTYAYDATGRLVSITYPGGIVASYGYAGDRQISMAVTSGGVTTTILSSATYAPYGPATGWMYGNGLSRGFSYDVDGRLTGISTGTVSAVLQSLTYTHSLNDQVAAITNGSNTALSQTFGYDELLRLSSATASGFNQTFAHDANGNRISRVVNGTIDTYNISPAGNRLLSISGGTTRSYTYDTRGNVASSDGTTYSYDSLNRLSSSTSGGVATSYSVNGLGQRAYKMVGANRHYFVYGPDNSILAEHSAAHSWTQYLYFQGEPVAMLRAGQIRYIHADHLGRPEIVTDGSQSVVWRANNYAFSRTVTVDAIGELNLGLPGQYFDSETSTWNNGFRDYDDRTGRYLQADPVGLAGGINTYSYVEGNPVNMIDPDGLRGLQSRPTVPQPNRYNNPNQLRLPLTFSPGPQPVPRLYFSNYHRFGRPTLYAESMKRQVWSKANALGELTKAVKTYGADKEEGKSCTMMICGPMSGAGGLPSCPNPTNVQPVGQSVGPAGPQIVCRCL